MAGGPARERRAQRRRICAGAGAAWLFLAGAAVGQPAGTDGAEEPSAEALMDALMWGRGGPVGGPLGGLIDHAGVRRSEADFLGRPALLYFGYTHCPDVCPTDLQAIAEAADLLDRDGASVQMLFVTLDPERDTAERLADYVALFHPRLVGLTGAPAVIRRVARDHKVYIRRVEPPDASDYLLDHSAFIYLRGADGRHLGFFPPGTPAERIAAAVRAHVRRPAAPG
jgi:cytochrome oxidase Cu insertion factor (SCO1/SenC/PrrC family)